MSKRVIGYEVIPGVPWRRPTYAPEGPSCARGLEDSLAATIMVDLLPVGLEEAGGAARHAERQAVQLAQRRG